MEKGSVVYGVWQDGEDEKYWSLYDSIEDAIGSENSDGTEVYELKPVCLGTFKSVAKLVKIKKAAKRG